MKDSDGKVVRASDFHFNISGFKSRFSHTVRLLESTTFGFEIRGFENSRIALVVTLKIVMSKGQEFSLDFSPLVLWRSCNTNNDFFLETLGVF